MDQGDPGQNNDSHIVNLAEWAYSYARHPHILSRRATGPIKVADQHATGNAITRFNAHIAVVVTSVVGSMWCAYAFAAFDCLSLPIAIKGGISSTVSWVAQTFLQLVLLSIIMVGQNVQAAASDKRAEQTYHDASATLHEAQELQKHLEAQDAALAAIIGHVVRMLPPQSPQTPPAPGGSP